ncbi:histone H1.5 isoform X1 [Equus asinus]|uniref:histone H1.5 isoform X1 n=1 Tax=Equus asinus TaxID=9793 RepID=UPI0038F7A5D5
MSETAPAETAAPAPVEKSPAKKKAAKKSASGGAAKRKATGPPVSELITKAVAASKERNGLSLAALKKALAAGGYDVEKNNSRIKLGLRSLVSKGTLVQTKGTGASGSFKLNKKAASGEAKPKTKKAGAAKAKKPAGATPKKPKKAAGAKKAVKKTPKKAKKPAAAGVKKVAKSPKKAKAAAKPKKAAKSPAKPKAVKPKAAKPKASKPKAAKPKAAKAKKAAPKKNTAWMLGSTPPCAMVTLPSSLLSSSSLRMASCRWRGMMRVFLLSRAALPASSRISAVRYSSTAARYTGAPAPTRSA